MEYLQHLWKPTLGAVVGGSSLFVAYYLHRLSDLDLIPQFTNMEKLRNYLSSTPGDVPRVVLVEGTIKKFRNRSFLNKDCMEVAANTRLDFTKGHLRAIGESVVFQLIDKAGNNIKVQINETIFVPIKDFENNFSLMFGTTMAAYGAVSTAKDGTMLFFPFKVSSSIQELMPQKKLPFGLNTLKWVLVVAGGVTILISGVVVIYQHWNQRRRQLDKHEQQACETRRHSQDQLGGQQGQ